MQLGETIATYDVALALRGESGKFEVTCPTGETLHVTCKNHSISNLEWSGGTDPQPFVIRKIAEPVSPEVGKATVPNAVATQNLVRAPFLLENQGDEARSGTLHDGVAVLPKAGEDHPESGEVTNFDLLYLENNPSTKQPTACICLKGETSEQSQKLMTNMCTSLNEFDSEIRRLHAQLDEIRSRARKLFYQSGAVAASA